MILLLLLGADCPTLPVREGDVVAVIANGAATCDGVIVPPTYAERAAELAAREAEGQARITVLEGEIAALRLELQAAEMQRDYWRSIAERPDPLLRQPGVGVVAGVGLCVASGWALGQAGR